MHLRGDIKLSIGQATDAGPKERNEDTIGIRVPKDNTLATKGITAALSDGVSAASAAKEASESAVLGFLNDYYETPESWEVKTSGQRVIGALNRWLFSQGTGYNDQEKGCVCTFTAVVIKSQTAHLFHIGDSRLYRLKDGSLEQISRDHASQVSEKVSYLTRALGLEQNPQVDYQNFSLNAGDRLLLTTDGIHGELSDSQIRKILSSEKDAQAAANQLSEAAQASNDNRSCIVIDIEELPDVDKDAVFRRLTQLPFPPEISPGMTIDGLRVERTLAASKNTQLYAVTEEATGREMVMKTPSVNFSDDPSYLERFALEEWIGLRTQHINLVRVLRPQQNRSYCYYLLEHVPGITLAQWIKENPKASLDEMITLITQIISGVRALHRKDILHQDLKLENILVMPGSNIKVIDYGSCHIGGISEISSPFERHSALGTVDFSAPEYRYGARPSNRSDLFSIAVIAYHLITGGQHPYGEAWHKAQSLRDFTLLKYISATQHNPMVPLWLDAALKKSLAPTASARHETMSEFLKNLKHPDYSLLDKDSLPFLEKNPVLVWKIISAVLLVALIIALSY